MSYTMRVIGVEELTPEQEQLFQDNLYLIHQAIGNKWQFMYEDAQSIAYEQLLNTVREYKPEKGNIKTIFWTRFNNAMINAYLKNLREKGRKTYNEKLLKDRINELKNLIDITTDVGQKQDLEHELKELVDDLSELETKDFVYSLDAPIGEEEGGKKTTLKDVLRDEDFVYKGQDATIFTAEVKKHLSETEKLIYDMVGEGYTFQEIANNLSKGDNPNLVWDDEKKLYYNKQKKVYEPRHEISEEFKFSEIINPSKIYYILMKKIKPIIQKVLGSRIKNDINYIQNILGKLQGDYLQKVISKLKNILNNESFNIVQLIQQGKSSENILDILNIDFSIENMKELENIIRNKIVPALDNIMG